MNTLWKAGAAAGALLLLALLSCGGEEVAPTIVVDSTADIDGRDGVVTLREAILLASGGLAVADLDPAEADNVSKRLGPESSDTIIFDPSAFPASTGGTISLVAPLPALSTGSDTIDGSQAGVIIDGVNHSLECIVIGSNDNAVRGLQIENCLKAVMVQPGAQRNEIGSPGPGQGNVISANDEGIVIGGAGAEGNVVRGNLIGVDAGGSTAMSNRNGVHIYAEARANLIGGSNPGDRNIISGNEGVGITISGSANIVQGNYIGTDTSGTAAIPNAFEGIWIAPGAQDNVIGGSTPEERNIISGNELLGLRISGPGATGNVVKGNYVGVDASGSAALANRHSVDLAEGAQNNVIGGSAPGEGNIISAVVTGVLIRGADTSGNAIIGNNIGMDATGSQPLPSAYGIWIFQGAHANTVGGTGPGEGNIIAGNKVFGVQVEGPETVGNAIRGNSIYDNGSAGIRNSGGGNGELKPPIISGVSPLVGSACPGCAVDIYSDSGDQGEVYEGATAADADGRFSFEGSLSGPNVTATVTDSSSNTSAFSRPLLEAVRQ
ncbi:MAG: CSLREA domain-containing protein [Chloroflexota bacterium]|nr:CSLREA domain-containing protein [Chloroflexota bacterium]